MGKNILLHNPCQHPAESFRWIGQKIWDAPDTVFAGYGT
jgi:hypothetical protein